MNETHVSSPKAEPFSAALAVAAGIDFAELRVGSAGLFWNEYRPQDAACRLWHWRDGQAHCLTPTGFSVRSRVYEYGSSMRMPRPGNSSGHTCNQSGKARRQRAYTMALAPE